MSNKINIERLEEYLKKAGLANGELAEILEPIKDMNNQRRYGLVWEEPDTKTYGTDSAEQELLKNFPFLKEVNEHRIFNGEGNPDHLLIEGDNLHALQTMQYTHKNKIDVIYIDPPYNTGNTDFVYNDKFVDGEDSWRHSKWLSFMNKRLRLARELMTDEGVIFISIDEFEFAQLKLLCDQVFGELNFIANITWDKRNPKGNSKTVTSVIEYILVYGKNKNLIDGMYVNKENAVEMVRKANSLFKKVGKVEKPTELRKVVKKYGVGGVNVKDFEKEYTLEDANNEFSEWLKTKPTFTQGEKAYKLIDEEGRLYRRVSMAAPKKSNNMTPLIHPDTGKPCPVPRTGWRNKPETMEELLRGGLVDFGQDETTQPNRKYFLTENMKESLRDLISYAGNGIDDLTPMGFSFETFDNPKPVRLIKKILEPFGSNATVLDFFAGSGTTAHAVMELNKEDGGNRKAIVITNNEINSSEEESLLVGKGYIEAPTNARRGTNKHTEWLSTVNEFKETPTYKEFIQTDEYKDLGIARAVTEQRINKVINGYTTPKGQDVEGLSDNNFYHFEVVLEPDLMDMDLNTYVLVKKTKDIIRLKEGVYTNEEDIGTETTPAVKLVNDDKEVIVVLSVRVTESDIENLISNFTDEDKQHTIYTSYTGYDYGLYNINFQELPKELLQAIKHNESK